MMVLPGIDGICDYDGIGRYYEPNDCDNDPPVYNDEYDDDSDDLPF